MKTTIVLQIATTLLVLAAAVNGNGMELPRDDSDTYDTKYDDIDLDQIIANERLLKNYINCLLNEGPCTPDGQELKDNLPDAISNDCERCSEKQKIGSTKMMHHMIDSTPDDWDRLEKIYDPSGVYRKNYLSTKTSSNDVMTSS